MFEPLKYLVQPVAIERDESGRVVAERVAETQAVFSAAEAQTLIENFERELQRLNKEEQHAQQDNGRAEAESAERASAGRVRHKGSVGDG